MDRFKATKISSILGIVGNIFLLIIKGIIGYITSSQSMIADAFNSAGDIFSSCMTFIGNKISSKEADEDHHLGHGKAEYIYSLLISITMIVLSVTVIKNAIMTLVNKEYFEYSIWLIIICFMFVVFKEQQKGQEDYVLDDVFFWTMPQADLNQAEEYWNHIKENILNDNISEKYWWKAKDRKKFHIRPKAQKATNLAPTPNGGWAKKFCYWFNNDFVRDIVDNRNREKNYGES